MVRITRLARMTGPGLLLRATRWGWGAAHPGGKEASGLLRQGVVAGGRRPPPPAAAKESAVRGGEQHKRAWRTSVRPLHLCCRAAARI